MSEPEQACRRHRWMQTLLAIDPNNLEVHGYVCVDCGKERNEPRSRAGRNNRSRGNRAELAVARRIGGTKVGPLGKPWDVETPTMRLQVKKVAAWPSLNAVLGYIDAIPEDILRMRGAILTQPGRNARSLIVLDFKEFSEWYGDPTKVKP